MARMSISIPDDTKARMKAVETNWSAVAQRAFESELKHLESVKEVNTMSDVIERLRASKLLKAENLEKDGRRNGVEWAKQRAEYDQLKRANEIDTERLYEADIDNPDAINRNWVAERILAHQDWELWTRQEKSEAMARLFGVEEDMLEAVVTTQYIDGFIQGAADVWNEIWEQL